VGVDASGCGWAQRHVVDAAGLEVLSREVCLELLDATALGRVAITSGALPVILPVAFIRSGASVLFSAPLGSALDRGTTRAVVAFEADQVRSDLEAGWSVVATGMTRPATEAERTVAGQDPRLARWGGEGARVVAMPLDQVSGRRLA
jgi:nitroimidazol reductase NimA-like FMN-containing flavoprotein (pyridoxamine 5'-phosphate oxidase superfamily)